VGWRLRIRHHTGFQYAGKVVASYNEARLTPLTTSTQNTLDARLEVKPGATLTRYWDYWGTQVTAFDLHEEHDVLEVTGLSVVETSDEREVESLAGWDEIDGRTVHDRFVEMLASTPLTTVDEALLARAAELRGRGEPHEVALAISDFVRGAVDYVPGATGVRTGAQDAYDQGTGVCQDLAHLTVALLRAAGLPARYVSGYLHPDPDGAVRQVTEGQSHAWVEWWAGEWMPWDPTNAVPIGPRHVLVARGRDYDDVPPLKGVYRGSPSTVLTVRVEVERLA
jgi:transglutaminase-like putative cysteine protease